MKGTDDLGLDGFASGEHPFSIVKVPDPKFHEQTILHIRRKDRLNRPPSLAQRNFTFCPGSGTFLVPTVGCLSNKKDGILILLERLNNGIV